MKEMAVSGVSGGIRSGGKVRQPSNAQEICHWHSLMERRWGADTRDRTPRREHSIFATNPVRERSTSMSRVPLLVGYPTRNSLKDGMAFRSRIQPDSRLSVWTTRRRPPESTETIRSVSRAEFQSSLIERKTLEVQRIPAGPYPRPKSAACGVRPLVPTDSAEDRIQGYIYCMDTYSWPYDAFGDITPPQVCEAGSEPDTRNDRVHLERTPEVRRANQP